MRKYKVTAWNPLIAGSLELRPVSLNITRSLESPAVSMRGSFAMAHWAPELIYIRVTRGGDTIMEGKLDRQRCAYGKDGMTLELEARSNGAALLDNEAMPRSYQNLDAIRLFDDLIAPFGFLLSLPHTAPPLAEFTVRKDQSLWEVFCLYSRRVYGTTPHVSGNLVSVGPPGYFGTLVLGDENRPFSKIEEAVSLYHPIGKVVLRGEDGSYVTEIVNASARDLEISRARYLIPANEFAAVPVFDANQRIRRSMGRMRKVMVTAPGYIDVSVGQSVRINHPQVSIANMIAEDIIFTLDEKGEQTSLNLTSMLYI